MTNKDKLTEFEKLEIQMAFVVPLVRELQDILGKDVILDALRQRVDMRVAAAKQNAAQAQSMTGVMKDFERFAAGEDVLELDVQAFDESRAEVNVTACKYARMMEGFGATDLGELLCCSEDYALTEAAGVQLERTQTIMGGADCCDFKFCLKSATPPAEA